MLSNTRERNGVKDGLLKKYNLSMQVILESYLIGKLLMVYESDVSKVTIALVICCTDKWRIYEANVLLQQRKSVA